MTAPPHMGQALDGPILATRMWSGKSFTSVCVELATCNTYMYVGRRRYETSVSLQLARRGEVECPYYVCLLCWHCDQSFTRFLQQQVYSTQNKEGAISTVWSESKVFMVLWSLSKRKPFSQLLQLHRMCEGQLHDNVQFRQYTVNSDK